MHSGKGTTTPWQIAVVSAAAIALAAVTDISEPGAQPPGIAAAAAQSDLRSTASAPAEVTDHDSLNALLARGMLDRAETLAQQQMDALALSEDDAAKWAVALAEIRLAKLLRMPIAQQQKMLEAAIEPLERILRAYPDHRRSAWLRFQRLVVELEVAWRRAMIVLATPEDQQTRLPVLATLIQTGRSLQELEREVTDAIPVAFNSRDRSALIDELMSLRNAIAVKRVEALLHRGELFPAGSDDYLAAAGEAQQAAIDALGLIREEPRRRAELVRMRSESLLRMGQAEQADAILRPLMSDEPTGTSGKPTAGQQDDAVLALAVRIALDMGQTDRAAEMLAAHYGDQPLTAAAAPESDLARLQFLIAARSAEGEGAKSQEQIIGDWIEAIGQRGGEFARRRAEIIAAQWLGDRSSGAGDHRIIIAEAAAMLRQGRPLAAAEMLEAAAHRASEAATAHRLAIAAAAAFTEGEESLRAAEILRTVALTHEADRDSANLHLQSVILQEQMTRARPTSLERSPVLAGSAAPDTSEPEETNLLLRQTMARWSGEPAAFQARHWLVARLVAAGKHVEAAIAASPTENETATQEQWEEATKLWIDALMAVPFVPGEPSANSTRRQLTIRALQHLPDRPSAARRGRSRIIALFGEVEDLPQAGNRDDAEPFIGWLLKTRRGEQHGPPPLAETAPRILAAARWRLAADAYAAPTDRPRLASIILTLGKDQIDLPNAQALIWSGDWQAAERLLDKWVAADLAAAGKVAETQAAQMLASAPQPDAKQRALDRYATLTGKWAAGSREWHQAKLAMMELLSELNRQEDASRLAKYILLTRPPQDQALSESYRRWSER